MPTHVLEADVPQYKGPRGFSPLPALSYHVERFPCPSSSSVIVTHILDTAVPFIDAISRTTDIRAIVGIPYSTAPSARHTLQQQGHRVVIPDDIGDLPACTLAEIQEASSAKSQAPLVVQEIGGYCSSVIDNLTALDDFCGIVEDTKQGHWRYAKLDRLACPVLSIADSPLKALENQQVGRSISHALETILRRQFHRLTTETKVGLMGYGGIGEATARALSALGARVTVFDTCGIRMAKAALDGFGETPRAEIVANSDVLLGVSGHCSIGAEDFLQAKPNALIASGSSKQVEIELAALNREAAPISDESLIKEYRLEGKSVFLLNDGMPINFLEHSILGRVLDLVYTELYMCIREIASGGLEPGLGELPISTQREIAQAWRRFHWL